MIIEKSSATVFTPLEDETAVLLNLDTRYYYNLNRTGATIWREIEKQARTTLDELVVVVCRKFNVDEHIARRETGAFIERLEQLKMVRVEASGAPRQQ